MTAFDEIFDEAVRLSNASHKMPRQKRGRAIPCVEANPAAPAPDTNPPAKAARPAMEAENPKIKPPVATISEMQAVLSSESEATTPAKKKAVDHAQPEVDTPSSSPIPRKRGRPSKVSTDHTSTLTDANNSDGHHLRKSQVLSAIGTGRVDQPPTEALSNGVDAAILSIVAGWKMRQRWHRAEKALILQAKAICRAFCDGDKDAANAAYGKISKGEFVSEELAMALTPFLPAIERFQAERKAIEKDLKKRSKAVPTYDWAMSVRGFGELNFVAILGECCVHQEDGTMRGVGDYRTVSALWKRMGVALVGGERQRRVADAEMAILHGYNPSRRSVLFNVGECLIKAGGEFKALYDERKAYELARDGEIKPILAHRRAARYMTKRLLRKMYAQWRKETRGVSGDPDEIVLPVAAE